MDRVNILGVGVNSVDMSRALERIERALAANERGYVCVTGVHGIMEAQADPTLKTILNRSLLTVPDGMPTVWIGKLRGFSIERVFGPDLMLKICEISVRRACTHFLYGGPPGMAEQLKDVLLSKFPGLKIVGCYCPPFRPLTDSESQELRTWIAELRPDLFWVGLSTPKQERFMADQIDRLDVKLMIGVGAGFDIHSGRRRDAPEWVKNAGLQWVHRILQEPNRLWKRYLVNNPKFVWMMTRQLLGKRYPLG